MIPGLHLCPKTPLKKAGIRMLPASSEPMPIGEPAPDNKHPSPPAAHTFKNLDA